MCHRMILPAVVTLLCLSSGVHGACAGGWDISHVQLNGGGAAATVGPEGSVSLQYDYQVWNGTDCPSCIRQILVGLVKGSWSQVLGGCAFNAVPAVCPGKTSGSVNAAFVAPAEVGDYEVVAVMDLQYTCGAAQNAFPGQIYKKTIGAVTVAPAEQVIAYDDGRGLNMDLTENTLFAVRFTPGQSFGLTGVDVMFLNDRNTTDGATVWVSPASGGVPVWPATFVGQIPSPLPDSRWVRFNLAAPRYFAGDFFVVVQQKGSLFYPAYPSPSFWVLIDNGTTTGRTLKSPDDGRTWQTEARGDALIRAVGKYGSAPCTAAELYPPDHAVTVPTTVQLQWTPCPTATGQDVYLGTDLNAVLTATRVSPLYQGRLSGDAAAYTSPVSLNPCTEYYWRVDTLPCPTCPVTTGPVQSFTTTCDKPLCLPGDINADGIVDLKDLGILSGYWLEESATPCVAGTVTADIDDCAPTLEELTVPPAPEGYVYMGRTVVVNFRCTECTLPDDFVESPEDIVAIRSHTITKDGVVVCDVIISHTFRKKQGGSTAMRMIGVEPTRA